jgi:hypothetical protein
LGIVNLESLIIKKARVDRRKDLTEVSTSSD